jgi:hypothetical protein
MRKDDGGCFNIHYFAELVCRSVRSRAPVKIVAPWVIAMRRSVDKDNVFLQLEKNAGTGIEAGLNYYRDVSDCYFSWLFELVYGSMPTA